MAKREDKPKKGSGRSSSNKKKASDTGKKPGKSARSSSDRKKSVHAPASRRSAAKTGLRVRGRRLVRRKAAVLSPALEELLEDSARAAALHARSSVPLEMRGMDPLPITFIDRGAPLPEGYGIDRLVALPRDPWTLFVYWELNGSRLRTLHRERGDGFIDSCAWALRLHRVDEGVAHDVEVEAAAGCWYIHLDRQGRYQVELALLTPEGEWIALLASHVVTMPAEQPSAHALEVWTREDTAVSELDEEALRKLDELLWPEGLRGGASGFVGASRARSSFSSFSFVSSLSSAGSMGSLGLGSSARVAGSWESSAGVSSFGASSARIPGSGSSGLQGFGGPPPAELEQHHLLPAEEQRPHFFGGPNWNAQPALPATGPGKTQQPHFKVKLPRVLAGLPLPAPSWPSTPGNTRLVRR